MLPDDKASNHALHASGEVGRFDNGQLYFTRPVIRTVAWLK